MRRHRGGLTAHHNRAEPRYSRPGAPIHPEQPRGKKATTTRLTIAGNRKFESTSLQRRVLCEPTSRAKKGGLETMASQRGTEGSNPLPSSGESCANLLHAPKRAVSKQWLLNGGPMVRILVPPTESRVRT